MPGSPSLYRAPSLSHRLPQPVWKKMASPGRKVSSAISCRASAARTSESVISSPFASIRPFSPAASISTPRVKKGLTCSMPSFLRPCAPATPCCVKPL
jgi:hypothetical protein